MLIFSKHTRNCGRRALLAMMLLLSLAVGFWLALRIAQAKEVSFKTVEHRTLKGDLVMIGNTMLHCDPPNAATNNCPPNGNNRLPQKYLDIDGNAQTFNSSAARLVMPMGARIKWARLYWGGTLHLNQGDNPGQNGAALPDCGDASNRPNPCTDDPQRLRDKLLFFYPGAANYVTVSGDLLGPIPNPQIPDDTDDGRRTYVSSADVTALLQNVTGNNAQQEYRVANLQTARGIQRHAGWSLVVIYEDTATSPIRDIVVYNGFQRDLNSSTTKTLSGFKTPAVGPVSARFWSFSHEGDRFITGDSLKVDGVAMGDSDNYFKGRIFTSASISHEPDCDNCVGTDIQNNNVSSAISPGETSVEVRVATNDDGVRYSVFALVNNLNAPNVSLTKTANPSGSVNQNGTITYTITATNSGNDTANNVVITDPLPANTQFQSATGGGQFIDTSNGSDYVAFNLGSLPPGASVTVTFTVLVTGCGTTSNQATADFTAAASGVLCQVKTGIVTHTINGPCQKPELTIQKESRDVNGGKLRPGDILEYTVTVTNPANQTATAQSVVLGDGIPGFTTYVPGSLQIVTGANAGAKTDCHIANCNPPDQAYFHSTVNFPATTFSPHVVFHLGAGATSCVGGALAPGESTMISFQVRVNSGTPAGTIIENGAYVFFPAPRYDGLHFGVGGAALDPVGEVFCAAVPDPNPSGIVTGANSNITRDYVGSEADLLVEKSAAATVCAGDDLAYNLSVTNLGPDADPAVTLSDVLPTGVTPKLPLPQGCSLSPANSREIICNLGALSSGARKDLTITVTPAADTNGTITNEACVTGQCDPNFANNCATADTLVKTKTDLAVTKTPSVPMMLCVDGQLSYDIKVTNNGPQLAKNVLLTDTLPANVTNVVVPQGCTLSSNTVTCPIGDLASGAMQQFTISLKPPPTTTEITITNTATVTGDVCDTSPANNQTMVNTIVKPCADLAITKGDAPDPVLAGAVLTYTLNLNNAGPSNAQQVAVVDTLPPGVAFVSASSSDPGFGCTNAANKVTCTKATLAAGATAAITITAKVSAELAAGVNLLNEANVTAATNDPNLNNNRAAATTLVNTGADLAISKSAAPDPVLAGTLLTYTLNVRNNGPSNAQQVVVTDPLPTGATFHAVSSSDPGFACNNANNIVTCTKAVLAAGAAATIAITVEVGANLTAGTMLLNEATVTTTTSDPQLPNNRATTTALVYANTNLASVLVFNLYTSGATGAAAQNLNLNTARAAGSSDTRINLTNTNQSREVRVHLFFVDGGSCSVADAYICLTPNQTTSFLTSDLDPGTSGYLIAVAVDRLGCPVNFNYLIGDAFIRLASGHAANLPAEAIPAISGALPACDVTSVTALLQFDGISYSRLPRVLAADSLPDRASGNDTLLVLNRISGNLAASADPLGPLFGLLYDDVEHAFSFTFSGGCQLRATLSNSFPRTTPRYEEVIPAGRSGWLKLWSNTEAALLGAVLNFNSNAASNAGAFSQGRNLHKLRLTAAASLTIPVFPPSC